MRLNFENGNRIVVSDSGMVDLTTKRRSTITFTIEEVADLLKEYWDDAVKDGSKTL